MDITLVRRSAMLQSVEHALGPGQERVPVARQVSIRVSTEDVVRAICFH